MLRGATSSTATGARGCGQQSRACGILSCLFCRGGKVLFGRGCLFRLLGTTEHCCEKVQKETRMEVGAGERE